MQKIAFILNPPVSNPLIEDTLQRITADFAHLGAEVSFYSDKAGGLIKPLSELDRFSGNIIDLTASRSQSDDNQNDKSTSGVNEKTLENLPELKGNPANIKVTVEGVFLDKSGYALLSRSMVLGLEELGADVSLNVLWFAGAPDIQPVPPGAPRQPGAIYITKDDGKLYKFNTPVEPAKAQRILKLAQRPLNPEGRTLIACLPADSPKDHIYKRIRQRNENYRRYIGYTMLETEDLPRGWVDGCSYMDEIWVPSRFNFDSFSRSGVPEDKLRIMPLGVDTDLFHPDRVPLMQIPGLKGFNFLSIFQWTKRKGWDLLLKAYLKAFSFSDDVALVIRSYYREGKEVETRIRDYIAELGYDVNKIPRISVISQPLASQSMPSLYKACQAFVLPTRGEGWGLPYMEAMAMGLPVIATRYSAHLDFINDSNGYLIDNLGTEMVDEEQVFDSPLYLGTSWGIPSLEHTMELMKYVYNNYAQAREIGNKARQDILSRWTIKHQVQKTAQILLNSALPVIPGTLASTPAPEKDTNSVLITSSVNADRIPSSPRFEPKKILRVAMQNRPNCFDAPGGDTVVMHMLKRELENLNVKADYVFKLEDLKDYDLVHIFNFAIPEMVKLFAENAEKQGKPSVVTPMYEDWPLFLNKSFKAYYLFKEYVDKDQPRDAFDEIFAPLSRLKSHHRADNSFSARLASGIGPSGEREAQKIRQDYPYARNVQPVYLGCDLIMTEVSPQLFINETGLKDFILCVARLETRKNQLMLLKALEDDDIPLVFATGGFTYQGPYAQVCQKFKRKGLTIFLDRLSPEMLVSAYKAAKVHALPSWYELPGMVSVEAAHYDCNVVASTYGTIQDYLGDFGYYVEPDDPEGIRNAVLKALNDPVKSEQKELVAKFTWRNSARQMLNLYQKALADHQELKSLLDQASSQKSRGDLKSALNSYLKALEIHPHSPLALTEAAELLTLEKDPHADIYSEKLNTISRERSDKCVLNIPLKLQDDFIFAEMEPAEIALNLLNNGAIFEAEDMLQKELALNPSNDRALYGLGLVYFKRGKFTRAKDFLQKSVELKPSGDNLLYLASVLEKLNLCDQALLYLSQIRQIPGTDGNFDFDINRLKGHCLLKKGDFEQAEKCYHLASEIDPQSEKPWLGLGSIELLRKNFPRSQGYYHQALILNPASDKAHLGLALVDLEQGQFDSALEKVKAALDLNLENQQALMTCLNAAHRSGKLEVAQKYLARYSDLHPANTEILYTLAGIFTRLGNKEDAKATAHKILLLNPDHQPAAELLKQLG